MASGVIEPRKAAPAWWMLPSIASGSATWSARCSPARRSATAAMSSREYVTNAAPLASAARAGAGIGLVVGDHDDLARTGDAVDVDDAEDEPLGARDVKVAGADDLGGALDALRAVREPRDGLGAARVDDGRDAREVGGRVDRVVARVAGERRRQDDLGDPGHLRGDGRHDDARRVPGLAARRVDSGASDGPDAHAQRDARFFVAEPRVALVHVDRAAPRGRELHGAPHVGREPVEGRGAGVFPGDELRRAAAEALVIALDGGVALGAHGGEDLPDRGLDAREVALAAELETRERLLEIGRIA